LKGIKRKTVKGRVYVYRIVRGKHVRLPDLPENDPEFLRAYLAADTPVAKDGTLASLIQLWLASEDFARRKTTTQAVWRRRLDEIRQKYGKAPVTELQTMHINKALAKLSPGARRSVRTIWRGLLDFAVSETWRHDNPAKFATIAKTKPVPHAPWSKSDIAAFRKRWVMGTGERQAFEVIFWTAARCVDAATIGWRQVSGGQLQFVQAKTGGIATVPITIAMQAELEKDRRLFLGAASPEMMFILSTHGKPRTVKSLSQLVSRAARDAGLSDRTAHGLRKSRAIALAEALWTPHEIGAWTGHETLQEVSEYTRGVNKRALISGKQAHQNGETFSQVTEFKRENR
jgi:integrase